MDQQSNNVSKQLAVFVPFVTQLEGLKKINTETVFEYKTQKGNKAARSHIAKMRKSKAAVEKIRIKEARDYRDRVNNEASAITTEIDKMILVHQKPLDEFENSERIRIDALMLRLKEIQTIAEGVTSEEIQLSIDSVNAIVLDKSWEEYLQQATAAVSNRVSYLKEKLESRTKYESDQAELEKLREEKVIREKKETEELKAKAEEPEKSNAETTESAEAVETKPEPATTTPSAKVNPFASQRVSAPQSFAASDSQLKAKVNKAALDAFVKNGIPLEFAEKAIKLIALRLIPCVEIRYL